MCCVFFCFVTFPYGVSGQVWNLIESITDLCLPLLLSSGMEHIVSSNVGKIRLDFVTNGNKDTHTRDKNNKSELINAVADRNPA